MRNLMSGIGVVIILVGIGLLIYSIRLEMMTESAVESSNSRAVDCYLTECGEGDNVYADREIKGLVNNLDIPEEELRTIPVTEDMIGVFYSEDIDLVEPIYSGASYVNLARGIATVEESNDFSDQNVSIAGHRVEGPDIRFNRIDELSEGDIVKVGIINDEGEEEITEYRISDKFKVAPEEVDVMEQDSSKEQELTLITCESYDHLTNEWEERLILKAEIVG